MSKRDRPFDFDDEDEEYMYALLDDDDLAVPGIDEYIKQKSHVQANPLLTATTTMAPEVQVDLTAVAAMAAETSMENDDPLFLRDPPVASDNNAMDIDFDGNNPDDLLLSYERELAQRPQLNGAYNVATAESVQASFNYGSVGMRLAPAPAAQPPPAKPENDYSRPPTSGRFIKSVCPFTGKTLYFPKTAKHDGNIPTAATKTKRTEPSKNTHLLGEPFWKILDRVKERKRTQREADTAAAVAATEAGDRKTELKKKRRRRNDGQDHMLWAEKYRPKSFIDLLGDQRINREVLRWVKQWDCCVFGRANAVDSHRDKSFRNYRNTFPSNTRDGNNDEKPKDKLMRPEKKILLLSGAPGFGKTTLAHVVASQAGYNVVEINASDDRTGNVVESKIKSALEMQAIIKKTETDSSGKITTVLEQKPNLIIIDEIDGASSGGGGESFIKQLIQLATAGNDEDDERGVPKRRGKKHVQVLKRPIICICNDVYASVLRPLRNIAFVLQIRNSTIQSVAKRLLSVCDYEGLDTDERALSRLAESAGGDIRSCLNALQLVRTRSNVFTRDMLENGVLSQKDMGKSLFTVWEEIFNAPSGHNRVLDRYKTTDVNDQYVSRLSKSIMANGEFERLMQGCFESYLKMRYNDVGCQKIVQMNDWLDLYDHLDTRSNILHDYSFYSYLPYPIVNFHRFFAGSSTQEHRVEYPKVEYEQFVLSRQYQNLMDVFLAGVHPRRRFGLDKMTVVNELVPRLLRIISPDMRPVSKQLLKPGEKEMLSRVVKTMLEYGLTYVQEKNSDGQFIYKLDPPIEQLLQFESSPNAKNVLSGKYAVRQMIAQEVEIERLKQREIMIESKGDKPADLQIKATASVEEKIARIAVEEIAKPTTDYFGRVVKLDTSKGNSTSNSTVIKKPPVSYHFHEGITNAVRKPMHVHMFL